VRGESGSGSARRFSPVLLDNFTMEKIGAGKRPYAVARAYLRLRAMDGRLVGHLVPGGERAGAQLHDHYDDSRRNDMLPGQPPGRQRQEQ